MLNKCCVTFCGFILSRCVITCPKCSNDPRALLSSISNIPYAICTTFFSTKLWLHALPDVSNRTAVSARFRSAASILIALLRLSHHCTPSPSFFTSPTSVFDTPVIYLTNIIVTPSICKKSSIRSCILAPSIFNILYNKLSAVSTEIPGKINPFIFCRRFCPVPVPNLTPTPIIPDPTPAPAPASILIHSTPLSICSTPDLSSSFLSPKTSPITCRSPATTASFLFFLFVPLDFTILDSFAILPCSPLAVPFLNTCIFTSSKIDLCRFSTSSSSIALASSVTHVFAITTSFLSGWSTPLIRSPMFFHVFSPVSLPTPTRLLSILDSDNILMVLIVSSLSSINRWSFDSPCFSALF
ncbi:hypothetical protein AX774_g209 [Zancudomyces culisetae]|uniref:Uncharacterized protein n=1 Tax=Zancudomyces culisetae TaxID=1213189 RepID=A0A1R1PZG7_ZANCU|nr:hypothetical protein AX774_g209 [Zancudomyces culisetae]|eukprot:OMH86317.1 hypothetical protein AX774_g209 [Zancudomyces culisetae]